jgi:hypothetical protein
MINIAKEPAHGAVGLCPAGFALDSGRGCANPKPGARLTGGWRYTG